MTDYIQEAKDAAKEITQEFLQQIVDCIDNFQTLKELPPIDQEEIDNYIQESYLQCQAPNLREAVEILEQLQKWKETDSGIWQGMEPKQALCAQAAFTFYNAVNYYKQKLFNEIDQIEPEESEDDKIEKIEDLIEDTIANF